MDSVLAAAREGSRVIGLRYPDPESTKFLTRVLKALEIPYAVKNQDEAITVYWASASSEQEQEIQNRVSQFDFVRKVCPSLQVPLPSDVAKAELSC